MKYLQKIKCKAKLKRIHSSGYTFHFREWRRFQIEFDGVIIGKRNLRNGEIEYATGYTAFIPQDYFTAYLVSVNMNQNPVYVLPEDIELKKQ